ncbi:hypothetical protein DFH09DRAFT_1164670 [Mycena vulgaris]|nr:hypothetical protein DFH09DRAFT_1164670 [Mycena vulgaris]
MDQDHIQTPQELVNHIIDFLHDTTTALKACALVSRAFVHSAQSHIFKELSIGDYGVSINKTTTLWSRCQETLHTSPHLVQHIHRLTLVPDLMSLETFSTICNFLFTHLKEVCIRDFTLAPPLAIALQQLFSLPTLRFISTEAFHPTSHRWPAPIHLDSFRIVHPMRAMRDWIDHAFCPFDFSGHTEVLRWSKVAPCLQTLEALDFTAWVRLLILFPNFSFIFTDLRRPHDRPLHIPTPRAPPHFDRGGLPLADGTQYSLDNCALQ